MSSPVYEPWSHNPYAPKLPRWLHPIEASYFAGIQISALSYGIAVALLFKCITALLSSVKRKQSRFQWLLVAHTTTMFISLTIYTGVYLYLGAIAYIDNRRFTLYGGEYPGPTGYLGISNAKVIASVPPISMVLNGWLADGLLLHRKSAPGWIPGGDRIQITGSLMGGFRLTSSRDTAEIEKQIQLDTGPGRRADSSRRAPTLPVESALVILRSSLWLTTRRDC